MDLQLSSYKEKYDFITGTACYSLLPSITCLLRDPDKLQTTATEGEASDGYYETMRHIPLSSSPSQPTTTAAEDCHYDNV